MRGDRATYVLDSYALLACLGAEEGQRTVQEPLRQAADGTAELYLTVVNLGEVLCIVERLGGLTAAQLAVAAINQLPITVVEADRGLTFGAGHLKANYALAYADCLAVALAQMVEGVVVTGDPEFGAVGELVEVEWLPRAGEET